MKDKIELLAMGHVERLTATVLTQQNEIDELKAELAAQKKAALGKRPNFGRMIGRLKPSRKGK